VGGLILCLHSAGPVHPPSPAGRWGRLVVAAMPSTNPGPSLRWCEANDQDCALNLDQLRPGVIRDGSALPEPVEVSFVQMVGDMVKVGPPTRKRAGAASRNEAPDNVSTPPFLGFLPRSARGPLGLNAALSRRPL
jgi:hypothetical protein